MTAHNTIETLTNELTAKIHELNADTTDTWSSIYNIKGEIRYELEQFDEKVSMLIEEFEAGHEV